MHTNTHACTNTREHSYRTQTCMSTHTCMCAPAHIYRHAYTCRHASDKCTWMCMCMHGLTYIVHIWVCVTHSHTRVCTRVVSCPRKGHTSYLGGGRGRVAAVSTGIFLSCLEQNPIHTLLAIWLLNSAQLLLEPKDASVIHQNWFPFHFLTRAIGKERSCKRGRRSSGWRGTGPGEKHQPLRTPIKHRRPQGIKDTAGNQQGQVSRGCGCAFCCSLRGAVRGRDVRLVQRPGVVKI